MKTFQSGTPYSLTAKVARYAAYRLGLEATGRTVGGYEVPILRP